MASKIREYFSTSYLPGERLLLQKLDFFILTFCCICYFINYLDRSNLTNAYVSGMKEDLGFVGNQYNVINTCFTVGYVIGQIPSNVALHHFKPRLYFPAMMLIWGGLTMVTAAVQSPQSIMAIRFFLGVCEASTFVGTHYILGSWYTEKELGKRSGIFTSSGVAGTMIGGFIQSGIYKSLNGKHGLTGWRWLFIIDGLLTVPVAIYGMLLFPDTPHTTTAFYLSDAERELARSRVPVPEQAHHALPKNERLKTFLAMARKVLTSWYWWGFVMLWTIGGEIESFGSNGLLALYMQSHPYVHYTVSQLNNYPTGVSAVGIVSTLFWATLTDIIGGKRYLVGYWNGLTGIATSIMILVAARTPLSSTSSRVTFVAYYWAGSVYACQATFFAWCNDAMRYEDALFRGIVLAGMNLLNNALNAWWSIVFYGAEYAPWFNRGMWAMIAMSLLLIVWVTGLLYMTVRAEKQRQILAAAADEDASGSKSLEVNDSEKAAV